MDPLEEQGFALDHGHADVDALAGEDVDGSAFGVLVGQAQPDGEEGDLRGQAVAVGVVLPGREGAA